MCMNSTKIDSIIQRKLEKVLIQYPRVKDIVKAIDTKNGRTLLVGGAVRDLLLDLPIKDLDIEVHGVALKDLEALLSVFGTVSLIGKAFGVLRIHGLDIDWSLPRIDTAGRKPIVEIDPYMGITQAFRRRDLTINAMGIDLKTCELLDPFNGQKDLMNNILRATDLYFFVDDPLRLFRVMQFIGRFEMQVDDQLNALCRSMDISAVSTERIEMEFEKLFLKSKRPSLGIRWLKEIGRLKGILPELAKTVGVPQEPRWHPEGDVFEHSMQSLDAAAALEYETDWEKLVVIYAAMCHDIGKTETTKTIDGIIRSLGHEDAGYRLSQCMLERITHNKELVDAVPKLVKYHMQPSQFISANATSAAYKRLANKLAPYATLFMLAKLKIADRRGRNPKNSEPLAHDDEDIAKFIQKSRELNVLDQVEAPVLQGRDLLDVIEPGPYMGNILKRAYDIQLEEGIKDKEELKKRVLE